MLRPSDWSSCFPGILGLCGGNEKNRQMHSGIVYKSRQVRESMAGTLEELRLSLERPISVESAF